MHTRQRILIAPLDWGLGHATRCIPIIRLLLKKNHEIIIAADGRPLSLLKQEFPQLEFIRLKGYGINYPKKGSMILKMFFSIPRILYGICAEHNSLKQLIKEKKIDVVVSDNRFGLWNKEIKSIFITHQLMIKSPFAEKMLHKINLRYINKYDECWVPDVEGSTNLSGDLSRKYPLPKNAFFVGTLSRFSSHEPPPLLSSRRGDEGVRYDMMAIISGPEPQRSVFERRLMEQFIETNLKFLVVCGKTEEEKRVRIYDHITLANYLSSEEIQEAMQNSKIVIARSGYSTIMDLATLGKKAIFIPTPGQTEQEYLAEELKQKKIAFFQKQSELNLEQALIESEKYNGFETFSNSNELEKRIDLL